MTFAPRYHSGVKHSWILAALFAFITLGHLDVHAGPGTDSSCAMCSQATDLVAPVVVGPPAFTPARAARPASAQSPRQVRLSAHLSRGPPATV